MLIFVIFLKKKKINKKKTQFLPKSSDPNAFSPKNIGFSFQILLKIFVFASTFTLKLSKLAMFQLVCHLIVQQ